MTAPIPVPQPLTAEIAGTEINSRDRLRALLEERRARLQSPGNVLESAELRRTEEQLGVIGEPPGVLSPTEQAQAAAIDTQIEEAFQRPTSEIGEFGVMTPAEKKSFIDRKIEERRALEQPGTDRVVQSLPFEDRTEVGGVSAEGAPAGARAKASFAENMNPVSVVSILMSRIGGATNARIGPSTGEVEFFDNVNQRWTVFNPPGFESGDLAALAGPGVVVGSSLTGAVAGAGLGFLAGGKAGAAFGAVTGDIVGAAAGETAKLMIGQSYGLNQTMTGGDIAREAGFESMTALAGATIFGLTSMGLRMWRRVIADVRPEDAARLLVQANKADELSQEMRRLGSKDGTLTAKQALQGEVLEAEITSIEQQTAAHGPGGRRLRELYDQQRKDISEVTQGLMAREGFVQDDYAIAESGKVFRKDARDRLDQAEKAIMESERRAAANLESAERTIVGTEARKGVIERRAEDPASIDFGDDLRNNFVDRERRAFAQQTAQKYTAIKRIAEVNYGSADIHMTETRRFLRNRIRELDKNKAKWFTKDEQEGMEALLSQLETKAGSGPQGGVLLEPMAFDELQITLQSVRDAGRRAHQGLGGKTADFNTNTLDGLQRALKNDRDIWLSSLPDSEHKLAGLVQDAERYVFEGKEQLDRSVLAKIMASSQAGGDRVPSEKVFDTLFGATLKDTRETNARLVSSMLASPRGVTNLEDAILYSQVRDRIRAGFRGQYQKEVLSDKAAKAAGKLRAKAHTDFMEKHRSTMRFFFNEKEMDDIGRLGGLNRVLERQIESNKEILKRANRSFGDMAASATNPEAMFAEIWTKANTPAALDDVLVGTIGKPELRRKLENAAHQDMFRNLFTESGEGLVMKHGNLTEYLKANGPKMRRLFGDTYVNDLGTVEKFIARAMKEPVDKAKADVVSSAMMHIARAAVGLFTLKGRLMTAGIRMRSKQAQWKLAETLLDPKATAKMIQSGTIDLRTQAGGRILTGLGFGFLSESDPTQPVPVGARPLVGAFQ